MKITSISIPENNKNGLMKTEVHGFGKVVVVAGRNGSGKTRLFKLLREALSKPKVAGQDLCKLENYTSESVVIDVKIKPEIYGVEHQQRLEINKIFSRYTSSKTFVDEKEFGIIYFEGLYEGYKRAKVEDGIPEEQKAHLLESWESYIGLVESFFGGKFKFVGQKLTYDGRDVLKIIESGAHQKPFVDYKDDFSDGQKILLQLAANIHQTASKLRNVIIFYDEPENHLHPKVVIDALDSIVKNIVDGQLWIATHSLPLIAHFGAENVFLMEDGVLDYAGIRTEKVIQTLYGGDANARKLMDLLELPAKTSMIKFAQNCLDNPDVVLDCTKDDAQIQLAMDSINGMKKVLDFGAGAGRLLKGFLENGKIINYYACDKSGEYRQECLDVMKVLPDYEKRYTNDLAEFIKCHGCGSFDYIILCNVFHEMHPNDWIKDLAIGSAAYSLLKMDGQVIIIEDYEMPSGENAHVDGFFLLDSDEIAKLVNQLKIVTRNASDNKYRHRIKAHYLTRENLADICDTTATKAIWQLCLSSSEKSTVLRNSKDRKNGRQFALHSIMVSNSFSYLRERGVLDAGTNMVGGEFTLQVHHGTPQRRFQRESGS